MNAAWLDDLNAEQRAAATTIAGPVMIVAGPGTGKTKTLTARIAYLVSSGHARADQILALTFTKKAADEMRHRVGALLEGTGAAPQVSTFHALCHDILGGKQTFVSDAERLPIIASLPRPSAFKRYSVRELGLLISRYKNQAEDDSVLGGITRAYDTALAERGLIDFDDLLVRTGQLLADDPAVRTALQQRYTYMLVDEFQDTNRLQYTLLRQLSGHDNIFVIGDPNQSIYGFRGASGTIFDQFRADYPDLAAITLGTNYRSTPAVVQAGNAVFPDGPQLCAHRPPGGTAQTVEVLNEYSEANWIIDTIHRAVGGGDFMHAVSDNDRVQERTLRDFAILYRNRSVAAAFQKTIAASGLPYQVVGDGSPYDTPQLRAIIAALRAAAGDTVQATDGIAPAAWQAMLTLIAKDADQTPAALAKHAAAALGLASLELEHFIGTLVRFRTARDAVQYIDAIADQGFYDPQADAVTLLTIHASKGLEFPYVFVLGAEDGLLPYKTADPAEERRLLYVAMTRARDNLDILHARRRGGEPAAVSPFIQALPSEVLPRIVDPQLAADQRRAQKRAAKRSQQSLF